MRLGRVRWPTGVAEKIVSKHGVEPYEVEQVLSSRPHLRYAERGEVPGEDVYAAYGRTLAGRYLAVHFIYKRNRDTLVLSARDMTAADRRLYAGR